MPASNFRFNILGHLITTNNTGVFIISDSTSQGFATTRYKAISIATDTLSEPIAQATVNIPFTLSGVWTHVSANTIASNSTIQLRKNTANGNQAISITASTTGAFEDAVNTDSVVANDVLNYSVITVGAAGALSINIVSILWTAPSTASIKELLLMGVGI